MIKSDFKKNITISVILSFCIFFLWKFGILYSYSLSPIVKEGRLHIFADWAFLIKLGVCHRAGFDIYYSSSCFDQVLNYGNIFLYIPYFELLEKNKAISFIEKNFTWKLVSKKLSDLFING